ncbi:unnamed protein product [Dovyalis caffra]|uniref:Uncharacterized protein n=1 Tax=Dovyalis caffra TaxID=77055 RepID=A0AAV1RMW9_9ROSI|nr:unnamed protein product [Dovyalis caffra]
MENYPIYSHVKLAAQNRMRLVINEEGRPSGQVVHSKGSYIVQNMHLIFNNKHVKAVSKEDSGNSHNDDKRSKATYANQVEPATQQKTKLKSEISTVHFEVKQKGSDHVIELHRDGLNE